MQPRKYIRLTQTRKNMRMAITNKTSNEYSNADDNGTGNYNYMTTSTLEE